MKISLCMITKDEVDELDKCLASAHDLVDEIVIISTYDSQETKNVARKYNAKIYDFKWVNDFSAARNFSFSKASCDYIFWLDADDVILEPDRLKFKKLKETLDGETDFFIFPYDYAQDEFGNSLLQVSRERVIKKNLKPQWQGYIHECIAISGNVKYVDISITHNRVHHSSGRNLQIYKEHLEKGVTFSARDTYYYAKELRDCGFRDESLVKLEEFIQLPDGWEEDKLTACISVGDLFFENGDTKKAKEYYLKTLEFNLIPRAEMCCSLGLLCISENKTEEAIYWYEQASTIKKPDSNWGLFTDEKWTWLPLLQLCVLHNQRGDIKKSMEYNNSALKYRPNDQRMVSNKRILENSLKKEPKHKKINLGCGDNLKEGYLNVDLYSDHADEKFSLDEIPYKDSSIDEIYCEHALEHLPHVSSLAALKEWYRVLSDGGKITVKIPDLESCCLNYLNSSGNVNGVAAKEWYKYTIYGIQRAENGSPSEGQFHYTGFSKKEIESELENIGFRVTKSEKYDGWGTPSLHIEAVKNKKISVGFCMSYNEEAAQTRIRGINVVNSLKEKGFDARICAYYGDTVGLDVIVVGKCFSDYDVKNISILKKSGKKIVCDICEDILLEDENCKKLIELSDVVTVCSERLATLIPHTNVKVIEDAWE